MDRYSTGSQISKKEIIDAFEVKNLETKEEFNEVKEEVESIPKKDQIDLKSIDDRLMTIDDFLN